jgi:hypothetical protein
MTREEHFEVANRLLVLPELPMPIEVGRKVTASGVTITHAYSAEQMRVYGRVCMLRGVNAMELKIHADREMA